MRPDFTILKKYGWENIRIYGGVFRGKFDNLPLWKFVVCDTFKNNIICKLFSPYKPSN